MTLPADVMVVCWAILLLFWLVSALNTKAYARRGHFVGWLPRLFIVLVLVAIYSLPGVKEYFVGAQRGLTENLQWIGAVLSVCGVSFAIWARVTLGRNWGVPMSLKKDPELVTGGPYAYVRHPIYTGFLLAAIGSCFVDVWWILPFFVVTATFIYAAKTEERIMTAEFPNQYPDYMKRTKMLVPFVF